MSQTKIPTTGKSKPSGARVPYEHDYGRSDLDNHVMDYGGFGGEPDEYADTQRKVWQ